MTTDEHLHRRTRDAIRAARALVGSDRSIRNFYEGFVRTNPETSGVNLLVVRSVVTDLATRGEFLPTNTLGPTEVGAITEMLAELWSDEAEQQGENGADG